MLLSPWPFLCFLALTAAHAAAAPAEAAPGESPSDTAPPPSPTEILAAYAEAVGGPALLEIETESRVGTLLRGKAGKVPLETIATASGKWLYHQTFAYGDQVRYGCDGSGAWIQDTKGVDTMSGRQRLDLQLLLDPRAPAKLRQLFPALELAGAEGIGERDAYLIRATSPDGTTTELAFDRESGLLVRAGGMVFEDYRDSGRIKRPCRVLLGTSDEEAHLQMTMEFTDTRHDAELDESVFRRPDHALPFAEPPLYRTRREAEVREDAMAACAGVYQHPELPEVVYTVRLWQGHLMLERTGWRQEIELKPESETDYFVRFPGTDFHFDKGEAGQVTHLEIRSERTIRAERIR